MADGYDRLDNEGGGGSFVLGLLAGTVLGAGLGMLFAPKSGSELRSQLSERAGQLADTASEGYRKASDTAGVWADRGREMYDKARDAASQGVDKARDTASRGVEKAHDIASRGIDKAHDMASRGVDDAARYTKDSTLRS